MMKVNILFFGKVKEVDVYESMFEYIKSSDLSDLEREYEEGSPDYLVEKWQPGECNDTFCPSDERYVGEIEIDGRQYVRITRGETEMNYVPADSLSEVMFTIYHCDKNEKKCTSTGEVFRTEEEAEEWVKELRKDLSASS